MPPCYGGGMSSSDATNAVRRLIADFDRRLAENLKWGSTSVMLCRYGALIRADAMRRCCLLDEKCGVVTLWLGGQRIGSVPASGTRVVG